jgi:hypothetical protein
MMTISTRRASSLRQAAAIGIAAMIAAGAASPCRAAASPPNATETGWQNDLVNRPGCWTEGGYDGRYSCDIAGRR